ncbi:MAG: GyrI-like domain-containing protein [Parvularculaceae bacterium]
MADIERVELTPMTVVSVVKECAMEPAAIGAAIGDGFGALMPALGAAGVAPAGPPMVAYKGLPPATPTLYVSQPVAKADAAKLAALDGLTIWRTAEGPALKTMHKGPYKDLGAAYDALFAHVKAGGLEAAGESYEIYLNDPGETAEADLLTEIRLPLKG